MDFQRLQERALAVHELYQELEQKKYGKQWTREQIAQGLVGDVGDLMKLVLAKSGVRDIEDADKKFAHELSDCLWCLIVLAQEYQIDLEGGFLQTMDELEERVRTKLLG